MKKILIVCESFLLKILLIFFLSDSSLIKSFDCDLTIVGYLRFSDSIGRITYGLIDYLKNDVKINFINSRKNEAYKQYPQLLEKVSVNEINRSNITFYVDMLTHFDPEKLNKNGINIAYSMLEGTKIFQSWVKILNEHFDAVAVPDKFLINVYRNSGVNIPIFELPLGIYLNEFLQIQTKNKPNEIFTFGCLSSIDNRKNQKKLVEAFYKAFGRSQKVKLVLNGRIGQKKYINDLRDYIKRKKLNNIQIYCKTLSWPDYIQLMASFDCYVNISKGEGFSVTPRESLAIAIPTIVSNNSAQKTIARTNFVRVIKSDIIENSSFYYGQDCGDFFDCEIEDISSALIDVYNNYFYYMQLAEKGKEWVKFYKWENLKIRYLHLLLPQKIFFGYINDITDDYLITNSKRFFLKLLRTIYYKKITNFFTGKI